MLFSFPSLPAGQKFKKRVQTGSRPPGSLEEEAKVAAPTSGLRFKAYDTRTLLVPPPKDPKLLYVTE